MPDFVTLFPECENVHLRKDIGMIPFVLYKHYDYKSAIACFDNGDSYPYLDKEVKGLQRVTLHTLWGSRKLGVILFLLQNAKKIDILNVYHVSLMKSLLWGVLYKKINPKGCVYMKLDMGDEGIGLLQEDAKWKAQVKSKMLRKIDIVSAESKRICGNLEKIWQRKIAYIPNGYYAFKEQNTENVKKKNIILTVGRLGTRPKATELLLEAFAKADQTNQKYELRLVGPIEKEFESYIKQYFERFPHLTKQVTFTGNISDPVLLQKEYEAAKYFILPSRWESFGIVLVEALCNGCFLLVSDGVAPCLDVTQNEKYGIVFEADKKEAIKQAFERLELENVSDKLTTEFQKEMKNFGEQAFSWINICGKLDKMFEGLEDVD